MAPHSLAASVLRAAQAQHSQASRCLLERTHLCQGSLNTKLRGSLEPPGSPALLVPLQSQLRSQGGRATLSQALAPATP